MKKKVAFFLVLSVLSCARLVPAEGASPEDIVIIKLTSGGQIKGVIEWEDEKGMMVDMGYGTVLISKSDIEKIETPAGRERYILAGKWRRQKDLTEKAGTPEERKKHLEEHYRRIEESRRIKEEMAEAAGKETEHSIKFKDSSKIMVEAILNGETTVPMVVDTGATLVLVPRDIAEQLTGVEMDTGERIETTFADGTKKEGIPIVLRSIEVDDARAEDVEAVALDVEGENGLLGMSFLNRFHMRIDLDKKELILNEK